MTVTVKKISRNHGGSIEGVTGPPSGRGED